jgi:hypothetical protein
METQVVSAMERLCLSFLSSPLLSSLASGHSPVLPSCPGRHVSGSPLRPSPPPAFLFHVICSSSSCLAWLWCPNWSLGRVAWTGRPGRSPRLPLCVHPNIEVSHGYHATRLSGRTIESHLTQSLPAYLRFAA